MAISAAPKRKEKTSLSTNQDLKTERKIREVIDKGGSPSTKAIAQKETVVKVVNVHLTSDEVDMIAELRQLRPRDMRSKKKIPISLHAWLVEAAQEKIEREKKKYNLSL